MFSRFLPALFSALAASAPALALDVDLSGNFGAETRVFLQGPRFASQPDFISQAISVQPELYLTWDGDRQSLLFVPFGRYDGNDSRRTHADVRELGYIYAAPSWELRAGIRRVFWGVAESNHLVDVINQVDFVENIDLEDRLGQPMVNLALVRDWGTVDLFVLPGFRERTFPGRGGRFQGPLRVDTSAVAYESSREHKHVDFAARYSHYLGPFDIGLHHFWGTSRDPRFVLEQTRSGEPVLAPFYDLIHQTGTDIQATLGNWLLKLEGYRREGQGETFIAAVGGFEYTFVGAFGTAMDVGVLGEYHFDERGEGSPTPFNNDVFAGSRLAVNDAADTQVLGGLFADLNAGGYFLNLEASRRFGDFWKVEVEVRLFLDVARQDPLFGFNRDDVIQFELLRYF